MQPRCTDESRPHRGDDDEPVPTHRGHRDRICPAFACAVRGAGPVPVEPRDAVATATVLDAARRSATEREVVFLPE
jgi:predicted dehydrogenase